MLNEQTVDPDAGLVDLVIGGDRRATETFVRGNASWMLCVARRYLRDEALAEDCVQESFANAFMALGGFQGRARLRSWLHRIVVNAALMKLRSMSRRKEDCIDALLPTFDGDGVRLGAPWLDLQTPEDILMQSETCAIVAANIQRLPDSYRVVLIMRDIDGLETLEVARALNLSEANVKVRLHRARAALKTLIEPQLSRQSTELVA